MTDDEGGELSAGVRSAPLVEGRPQGKRERHAGIGYEIVQNFDVPVPQMMEQLPNIVQFFAALSPVPEQVIAVPKILPHDVPSRRLCQGHAAGGTAGGSADENLLSYDSGVSRAFGRSGLWSRTLTFQLLVVVELVEVLPVFSPGQNYSLTAVQIVDIPVPRPEVAGDPQGFPP